MIKHLGTKIEVPVYFYWTVLKEMKAYEMKENRIQECLK